MKIQLVWDHMPLDCRSALNSKQDSLEQEVANNDSLNTHDFLISRNVSHVNHRYFKIQKFEAVAGEIMDEY
jgi:hypothetical protein